MPYVECSQNGNHFDSNSDSQIMSSWTYMTTLRRSSESVFLASSFAKLHHPHVRSFPINAIDSLGFELQYSYLSTKLHHTHVQSFPTNAIDSLDFKFIHQTASYACAASIIHVHGLSPSTRSTLGLFHHASATQYHDLCSI